MMKRGWEIKANIVYKRRSGDEFYPWVRIPSHVGDGRVLFYEVFTDNGTCYHRSSTVSAFRRWASEVGEMTPAIQSAIAEYDHTTKEMCRQIATLMPRHSVEQIERLMKGMDA